MVSLALKARTLLIIFTGTSISCYVTIVNICIGILPILFAIVNKLFM